MTKQKLKNKRKKVNIDVYIRPSGGCDYTSLAEAEASEKEHNLVAEGKTLTIHCEGNRKVKVKKGEMK